MKGFFALLSILLFVAGFTACGRNDEETSVPIQTLATSNMEFALANASNITVHSFSLGTYGLGGIYWNPVTNEYIPTDIPAPLDGIIAVPEGYGAHPLVVILHGNVETDDITDRVYAGFDYLVQQLAAEGYVAVSFNIMVDFAFDVEIDGRTITGESIMHDWAYSLLNEHLEALSMANEGLETAHGLDLTGRILMNQIHMIGHSRGGMIADAFYRHDRDAGIERIRSITRLGTTINIFDYPYNHPNIPISILMAELDGEILTLDGQIVFDEILQQSINTSFAQITYLQGANHAFFNRFFENDDRVFIVEEFADFFLRHQDIWLTREEQEAFVKHYIAAFLSVVAQGNTPFSTFDPSVAQPTTMFGFPVRASTYFPSAENIGIAQLQGLGNATVEAYVQRWGSGELFFHPISFIGQDVRHFTSIRWTSTDGSVAVTPQTTDFSGHQALSIYVAVDSSNELNPQGQPQSFSLVLTDTSGTAQIIIIPPETGALYFHIGEEVPAGDILNFPTWRGFMPVSELRVPLSYFTDVNLNDIASITLQFDQTLSGAIMLGEVFLK
ncbi:MAG: hypothetical protein FWE05_06350 [Defluviitaleaceae bacterium]|nr:hypothetical protein [Defluviitaleaceae bacterium]